MTEPERTSIPGVVLATVLILAISGTLQVLTGLAGGWTSAGVGLSVVYGALNVLFAYHLYRRRQWARVGVLLLCGYGAVVAVNLLLRGLPAGIDALRGPIVYPILLFLPPARAWFARSPQP